MKTERSLFGIEILEAQEMERKRIAMDLHDSTIQSLIRLVHKTELCRLLIDKDLDRVKSELFNMTDEIQEIINDMRSVIYNLQPMSLTDIGLNAAIEKLADNIAENYSIKINCDLQDDNIELGSVVKLSLYRIVQEACSNVIKHAAASKINISVKYFDDRLRLAVEDNGCGFETDKVNLTARDAGYGCGLSIMSERVYLLGGTIDVRSKCGKGTCLIVAIPFKDKTAQNFDNDKTFEGKGV